MAKLKAKAEGASVKVLGSGCAKYNQLEAATNAALERGHGCNNRPCDRFFRL